MPGTATAAQIAQLRRMIAESDSTTYHNDMLSDYIESYPIPDVTGEYPYLSSGSVNTDWTSTFDLARAAAQIWTEKAATVADRYDFTADGSTFHRSQAVEQAMKMAAYWNSRRVAVGRVLAADVGVGEDVQRRWIGNLAEPSDDY